jgi:hypothetical protein
VLNAETDYEVMTVEARRATEKVGFEDSDPIKAGAGNGGGLLGEVAADGTLAIDVFMAPRGGLE